MGNKALFLDRDGVVNMDTGYVHNIDDFVFVEGIFGDTLQCVAVANVRSTTLPN